MSTQTYLVTIHQPGNITSRADAIHTILTSRDSIAPAKRVEVVPHHRPAEDDRHGDTRRAAQLRDVYRAEGGRAFALMLAEGLDEIADEDGSVSGADAVDYIYRKLTEAGAVTTCDECCCDHASSAEVCPFCEEEEPEDEPHDLGTCTCETCDEDRYETNYGGPRK